MLNDKRYRFWRVFWIVTAIYLFFMLLGIFVTFISPSNKMSWEKMLSWNALIQQGISLIFSALFYYFSANIFYKLFFERKNTIAFIRPIVLFLIVLAVYYALTFWFIKRGTIEVRTGDEDMDKHFTVAMMIFSYAFASFFYVGISLLVAYLTYLRDERKQRKILEEQKLQLEIEKSQANFNFLKAQINPHFLHNTLNFLYAKSLPYSPELSEGILTLSDIMRYALSEGNAKDGKAPLRDEIEHMRNVIKINQLRFSNKLNVDFDVEGVVNGAMIIPFVLITLVENAFKHGDLKSTEHPIIIRLKIEGNGLQFTCRNKKKTGPKELSTGIGLDNIKKRLDLAYPNNYKFVVKDEAEIYTTELTIHKL
jgi:sensor histidine kinase YesM